MPGSTSLVFPPPTFLSFRLPIKAFHVVGIEFYRESKGFGFFCMWIFSFLGNTCWRAKAFLFKTNKIHSFVSLLSFFIRIFSATTHSQKVNSKFIWCISCVTEAESCPRKHRFEGCMPRNQHISSPQSTLWILWATLSSGRAYRWWQRWPPAQLCAQLPIDELLSRL